MKKHLMITTILLSSYSCEVGPGRTLEIVATPLVNAQCVISLTGTEYRNRGWFDPAAGQNFDLDLIVQNNMQAPDADIAKLDNSMNVKSPTNNVTILGFNVCYYPANNNLVSEFGSHDLERPIGCDDTRARSAQFIPGGGYIPANSLTPSEARGSTTAPVLSRDTLQDLFGETFRPDQIPLYGCADDATCTNPSRPSTDLEGNPQPCLNFTCWSNKVPSEISRWFDDPWGEYPETSHATVVVQVQVVGETQDGSKVLSGWLPFPIDICVGCALNKLPTSCAPKGPETCANTSQCTYPDPENPAATLTSPCEASTCPAGSSYTCYPTIAVQGEEPTFAGCRPDENVRAVYTCNSVNKCPNN